MNIAAREQAQGIEQINQAITQMDQVTQQNAALVEEAAAAAQARTRMRVSMRRPEAAAWAVEPRALVLARGEWALTGRQELGGLPP